MRHHAAGPPAAHGTQLGGGVTAEKTRLPRDNVTAPLSRIPWDEVRSLMRGNLISAEITVPRHDVAFLAPR